MQEAHLLFLSVGNLIEETVKTIDFLNDIKKSNENQKILELHADILKENITLYNGLLDFIRKNLNNKPVDNIVEIDIMDGLTDDEKIKVIDVVDKDKIKIIDIRDVNFKQITVQPAKRPTKSEQLADDPPKKKRKYNKRKKFY